MPRTAVIVPTNRPARIQEFCESWAEQFNTPDVRLIVVEDAPYRTQHLLPEWVEHYAWAEIDAELGDKATCIPRRSGGVRSFGFWLAGQDESVDMVVSLDDDVAPLDLGEDFLAAHWRVLETARCLRWCNTMDYPMYPRGFPYRERESVKPMLNHGLWEGMPDIDAYTQLRNPDIQWRREGSSFLVPPGMFFSCCAMNVAFRREMAPFCFFAPLPDGMKRWDDIWAGLCFKRIADLHGWAVTSGYPCVRHERASDPLNNLRQELLGYGLNERLWRVVDQVPKATTPLATYWAISEAIRAIFPELASMTDAMLMWSTLWPKTAGQAGVPKVKLKGQVVKGPLVPN